MKKDKERVQDEVWTEARIRSFLDLQPPAGVNADYHRLQRAYQSMRDEDFAIFVEIFCQAGGNINARGNSGETLGEEIARHRYASEFVRILADAAAN